MLTPAVAAEGNVYDLTATQDDITRVIESIRLRDQRILAAEAELRMLRESFDRIAEDNRKLREDTLPIIRMVKDRSQPLPNPEPPMATPPAEVKPEKLGSSLGSTLGSNLSSGLSRKFSTKKLFLGSTPKNPSPTIHENSSLDPSAAAMAASSHLLASQNSPSHQLPQLSPTSPAYNLQQASAVGGRGFPRDGTSPNVRQNYDDHHTYSGYAPSTSTAQTARRQAPTSQPVEDPPLSAPLPSNASLAPSTTRGSQQQSSRERDRDRERSGRDGRDRARKEDRGESNPQVEIFKSFRVSIEDPCHKVLPVALKRYDISDDWRQYALYIVYGDQERCLGLEEKPLMLFKQLDREGKQPMFMLRKHASPPGLEGFYGGVGQGGVVGRGDVGGGGGGAGAGGGGAGGVGERVLRGEDGRPLPGGVL